MFSPQRSGTFAPARDTSLIQRLQHRDPAALGELYDAYGGLIYSLICRIVHDKSAAEDLVQETFLRVWRRAMLFDSQRGGIGPWLITIARNRALDYLRSADGRRKHGILNLDKIGDPKLFARGERNISIPHKISLHKALEKLGGNQRAAIDLAYFEGYSQTEIAAKLGHPLGTVKTWVRSALNTLREELRESYVNTKRAEDRRSTQNADVIDLQSLKTFNDAEKKNVSDFAV